MIALARKYRPKLFADLIVQDHVAAALRGAVVQGRVAHGYLFAGPRGVGKTTAARILAMALNCEKKSEGQGEPCGVCESCRRVWTGQANLDVVELDAASNRGVDDARDLRERAMYAASAEGRSKVYIVDEAHMLTRDAWNALLKILEEPPPGVVFVFATTEPQKIAQSAAPVLSRLQRFDFRRIGPHAIAERLRQVADAEKLAVDDDALALIARSADGGMRDGLSLLDQVLSFGDGPVTADRVREVLGLIPDDLYGELLRLVAERDTTAVFPLVDRLAESGADFGEFVAGAGDVLRAVLQTNLGGEPEGLTEGMQAVIRKYCSVLPAPDIVRLLTVLSSMETQLRSSGHPRLVVELLLLRWAMMDRTVEIGEVIRALGASGTGDVGRGTSTGTRDAGRGTSGPEQLRDSASAAPIPRPASPVPPTTPVPRPASPVPEKGPLSADRLRALWPEIIGRARASSAMLATLLADTTIEGVAGNTVTLAAAGHREGLEHKRDAIGKLLAEWSDGPVKVVLGEPGTRTGERNGPPDRLDRLTAQSANLERLKVLRAKDPTLGAAVDALDLELLE